MKPQEIQQQLNGIKDNRVSSFTDKKLDATRNLYKPVYQLNNKFLTLPQTKLANELTKLGHRYPNKRAEGKGSSNSDSCKNV